MIIFPFARGWRLYRNPELNALYVGLITLRKEAEGRGKLPNVQTHGEGRRFESRRGDHYLGG